MPGSIEGLIGLVRETPDGRETTGPRQMGREDFLRLLVAQLNNQDPLDPMDNGQFIAQLAQFSSLEQLMMIREATELSAKILAELSQPKDGPASPDALEV